MENYRHYIKEIARWGGQDRKLENVRVRVSRLTKNPYAIKMTMLFYLLISQTNFLNDIAYEVIVLRKDIKIVAKQYGKTESAIYKIISRQYTKLNEIISHDLLQLIKEADSYIDDLKYYNMLFQQLVNQHKPKLIINATKFFTFDIESVAQLDYRYNQYINDGNFKKFVISILKYTSKPYLDNFVAHTDKRLFGYLVHLLNGGEHNLTDCDLERKKFLENTLMININQEK